MISADFSYSTKQEISPGKNILFPPMPATSTNKALILRSFGLYKDVLAYPTLIASYVVSVRRYRILQSRFLQCLPRGKPPCDLLVLRDVIPAHKGLAPSRLMTYIQTINQRMPMLGTHNGS